MDPNSYYDDLMSQGYSSADASHFTQQYYPEFQGQGMAAMAPPPGGMEMGGMAAGGFGAPAGGMAAGGAAAGGAAAAGGGMKIAIISVVSVLALGGAATGGYFLYDYLTEPDFYGEVYWSEYGYGYVFEEDSLKIGFPEIDDSCEFYEDMDDFEDSSLTNKDGVCWVNDLFEKYSSEDEGDFYKICATNDEDEDSECFRIYPMEGGMIMKNDGMCNIMVSDISTPPSSIYDDSNDQDEYDDWNDEFMDVAEAIYEHDDAPSCTYMQFDELEYETSSSGFYQFDSRDAYGDLSSSTGDDLIYIQMIQGSDGLNWATLAISISVDSGASIQCSEGGGGDCTYETADGSMWDVSEEILISEGSADLCDGSNGYCEITVVITKLGVGDEDDRIIAQLSAYAE